MAKRETSGQITELERGRRYSIRVRLAPDENHKSWHWSKSRKVNGNKAEATAALVAYKQELEDERSGKNVTVGEYAEAFQANRKPDVYLEVQHPCWSCNSNSSSANASAARCLFRSATPLLVL